MARSKTKTKTIDQTGNSSATDGLLLVTCCTSTRTVLPRVRGSDLGTGLTMAQALEKWLALLDADEADITPMQLYRGVGFHTVTKIADLIGQKNVRVLTGGQGLLKLDTKIVPYDFTSNKNHPGNMLEVVNEEPFVIPLWWNMINGALRGSTTPVADLLDDDGTKIVIIALNQFFMKYLHDDILSARHIDRLRIVVVGKSRSNVPTQLRQQVLQVQKSAVAGSVGNRNDISHRAALLFIRKILAGDVVVDAGVEEHQAVLGDLSPGASEHLAQLTPRQVFVRAPDLLKYDAIEPAYQEARRRYGAIGGIIAFRAAWYTQKGSPHATDEYDAGAASAALEAMRATLSTRMAKHAGLDSDAVWRLTHIFVDLLRKEMIDARFNAADLQSWMVTYCRSTDEKEPRGIDNLHKIGQFLVGSHEALGLKKFKSQGGGVLYSLK